MKSALDHQKRAKKAKVKDRQKLKLLTVAQFLSKTMLEVSLHIQPFSYIFALLVIFMVGETRSGGKTDNTYLSHSCQNTVVTIQIKPPKHNIK